MAKKFDSQRTRSSDPDYFGTATRYFLPRHLNLCDDTPRTLAVAAVSTSEPIATSTKHPRR
jgi:hypothetical protein